MSVRNRVGAAATVCVLLAASAYAQYPQGPAPYPQALPGQPPRANFAAPAVRKQGNNAAKGQNRMAYRPTQYQAYPGVPFGSPDYHMHPGSRSILRRYPYASNDATYGYRNPGGVGRFQEYYPPYNEFQTGGYDPTVRAGFNQGLSVGSLEQQAMAYNAGTARYAVLQNHIDNYARPLGFFGMGWGFGVPF